MSDRIVPKKLIASPLPIIDIDYSIVDIRIIVPEIVWWLPVTLQNESQN